MVMQVVQRPWSVLPNVSIRWTVDVFEHISPCLPKETWWLRRSIDDEFRMVQNAYRRVEVVVSCFRA